MSRKHQKEDIFQPLSDSGPTDTEEPQRSGRGREIKLGLFVLVLALGATGYVAYTQLTADDEELIEMADGSGESPLNGDADVAIAEPAVIQPDALDTGGSLVPAQWTNSSNTARQDASPWPSPKTDVVQAPQSDAGGPGQSYSTNYGSEDYPRPTGSAESTFDIVSNPESYSAPGMAPSPTETPQTEAPLPARTNLYGSPASEPTTIAGSQPMPSYSGTQVGPARPTVESQYPSGTASPWQQSAAQDAMAATQPKSSGLPTEIPSAPAYTPPSSPYGASAFSTPSQEAHSGGATTTDMPAYTATPATPSPTQDLYDPYPRSATSRTAAGYAGLSGTGQNGAGGSSRTETWQQPSVAPMDGNYMAQPNDNFYTISKKVYGTGAYFEALARHNKEKYPKANQIRIGDVVQTPTRETLEGRYPDLCPKPEHRDAAKRRSAATAARSLAGRRVYVVQAGDNLFDIARFELGSRAKVAKLIELNRDVLGDQIDYLTPGMRLRLPESNERGPAVTQGPTNTLR